VYQRGLSFERLSFQRIPQQASAPPPQSELDPGGAAGSPAAGGPWNRFSPQLQAEPVKEAVCAHGHGKGEARWLGVTP